MVTTSEPFNSECSVIQVVTEPFSRDVRYDRRCFRIQHSMQLTSKPIPSEKTCRSATSTGPNRSCGNFRSVSLHMSPRGHGSASRGQELRHTPVRAWAFLTPKLHSCSPPDCGKFRVCTCEVQETRRAGYLSGAPAHRSCNEAEILEPEQSLTCLSILSESASTCVYYIERVEEEDAAFRVAAGDRRGSLVS